MPGHRPRRLRRHPHEGASTCSPAPAGRKKPYLRHFVGGGHGRHEPHPRLDARRLGEVPHLPGGGRGEDVAPASPHPAGAFLTIFDHTTEQPLELTLIHIFAIEMCRFMHAYGYTEEEIAQVSVLCKKNALDHPAAQIAQEITVEDVMNSPVLSWPVKRLDISPTSDAAVAIVLANEHVARTHCKRPGVHRGRGLPAGHRLLVHPRPRLPELRGHGRPGRLRRWPGSPSRRTRSTSGSRTTRSTTRRSTT